VSPLLLLLYVFVLAIGGALFVARSGHLLGLIDRPNQRSSHQRPTPKGGGIGILAGFVLAAWALDFPLAFFLPPTLLSIISLYGDKIDLSFKLRLVLQFALAGWFLWAIFPLGEPQPILTYALCGAVMVFIVGSANFYNFMDGINGLAGLTGLAAFGMLAWFCYLEGRAQPLIWFNLSMAVACLGFLPLNLYQAKVFMGDVASVLLGFVFAGMVVKLAQDLTEFVVLASFLFPFYTDELTSMIRRIRRGENLAKAHRSHLYQVLCNEGKREHHSVSMIFFILQLMIGMVALEIKPFGLVPLLLFLGMSFVLWAYLAGQTKKRLLD